MFYGYKMHIILYRVIWNNGQSIPLKRRNQNNSQDAPVVYTVDIVIGYLAAGHTILL